MVGECWLQSARVARKAGHHQTAYNALLNAGESRLAELYVERAKWLWSKVTVQGVASRIHSAEDYIFLAEAQLREDPEFKFRTFLFCPISLLFI